MCLFLNLDILRDTAGQERFRTITRSHFRNSKGIILAYDITSKESFEKLEYWVQSLTTVKFFFKYLKGL